MDRKANIPPPPVSSNPIRPASAEGNLTSSSSSSSSFSPPDFLRQVHAVFKRHRPLGKMQSNVLRATRVLVSQNEPSRSSTATGAAGNQVGKAVSHSGVAAGVGKSANVIWDQRKARAAEGANCSPDDSLLTSPSLTGIITTTGEEKMSPLGLQKGDAELPASKKQSVLAASSSQVAYSHAIAVDGLRKNNITFLSTSMSTESRMEDITSYLHFLALTEGEGHQGVQVAANDQDLKQQDRGIMDQSEMGLKFGGTNLLESRKEQGHNQHNAEPVTRCLVVDTSCATTLSVHSGPTFQSTRAPAAGQTAFSTEMSSSAVGMSSNIQVHAPQEEQGVALKDNDWPRHHQGDLHLDDNVQEKVVCGAHSSLPSQVPSKSNSSSNLESSQPSKSEKAPRKKRYDPDVFFKVNGKLYQKLGKIGSGGSSEVHKVISSDCTIFALKKIKLKGRDYPTAYGFCQEIKYLNKLKGKSNIIQLIDFEVTDKSLLQEVGNGSLTFRDKRIKEDECIYMVLEYGEIDLAHMLSQKWKETSSSTGKIDENWLRFYWQQMLEAVNTIHEERIVHSDLKPANFLLVRGSLKLIDFGIAKAIMSDTTNIQRDSQVGTLNYMSPEAFMCNEPDANGNTIKCGRPSDIWSLGCILYQMVYGKTPFSEYKTFWAKFKVITDRNYEIVYEPVANPWLIDLMRRCLAWDRNERWRIPQLLQHPFLVPQMRSELPAFHDHHRAYLLMEKVGAHWTDPEVSRLCSELHEVISKLEKGQSNSTALSEPKDTP